ERIEPLLLAQFHEVTRAGEANPLTKESLYFMHFCSINWVEPVRCFLKPYQLRNQSAVAHSASAQLYQYLACFRQIVANTAAAIAPLDLHLEWMHSLPVQSRETMHKLRLAAHEF